MNPPFSNGDRHLLRAIELQKDGGKIICILNAETLKNQFSNTRKDLARKLEEYDAEIEYITEAFTNAERTTDVEVALIKIDIPKKEYNSTIIQTLKQEEQHEKKQYNSSHIVNADFMQGIVERYNFEVKAGLRLIEEYEALAPLMLNSLDEDRYANPILKLELHYKDESNNSIENSYIRQLRSKYWKALFASKEFVGLFTNNLRQKYYDKIEDLADYDFSLYNIYAIREELSKDLVKGVEDTILELFDEFSHQYSYINEKSPNIHYYNGWKTNKAHKINKKIIIRLNGFDSYDGTPYYKFTVKDKLADIEKVFNYLDGGITEYIDLFEVLDQAEKEGQTKNIETKYFYCTFYKKGTCHITFKDMDLLKKFNLTGARYKNWLPPTYGNKAYSSMNEEEKAVIDDFEGEKSYNETMNNKNYYILDTSQLLALTS